MNREPLSSRLKSLAATVERWTDDKGGIDNPCVCAVVGTLRQYAQEAESESVAEAPVIAVVLAVGTRVKLAGDIKATVFGVMVKGDSRVSYQVVWWNERTRVEEWVHASEVAPEPDQRRSRIGFVPATT